jgi:hypothetical protein
MAYATMTKQSAGYIVTASDYGQIIDNDEACAAGITTTKGDLAAGTGSKALARLAAGSDYKVPYYLAANSNGMGTMNALLQLVRSSTYLGISNTSAEQTLLTGTVPANYLYGGSAARVLGYHGYVQVTNSTGSNQTVTFKLYYDTGSISVAATIATGATYVYEILGAICCNTATNSQMLTLSALEFVSTGARVLTTNDMVAIDSTSAKTAKISLTFGAASASLYAYAWWQHFATYY